MLVMYLVVKDCRCLLTVVNLSTTTWKHRPAISDSKSLVPIWPQRVTNGHTSTRNRHSKAIYVHVRGLDVVKMSTIVILRPSDTPVYNLPRISTIIYDPLPIILRNSFQEGGKFLQIPTTLSAPSPGGATNFICHSCVIFTIQRFTYTSVGIPQLS